MLILLLISSVLTLENVIKLDKKSPSFAIHSGKLNRLGNISIIACKRCDILVDYTQRNCLNEPMTQKEYLNKRRQTLCFDPLPITINEEMLDNGQCVESWPYVFDLTKYLFVCRYEFNEVGELLIKTLGKQKIEYGLSFRVRQWVDDGMKVLVIPESLSPEKEPIRIALVEKGIIATVVIDRYLIGLADETEIKPVSQEDALKYNYCTGLQFDITCHMDATYSTFFGSDPGLEKDSMYHILDVKSGTSVRSRSSSTTIFSQNNCSFCIAYQLPVLVLPNSIRVRSLPIILTSYYFPWTFDDPAQYVGCFLNKILLQDSYKNNLLIQIDALNGGNLKFDVYSDAECDQNSFNYTINFNSSSTQISTIRTKCMLLEWCTKKERSGFKLWTSSGPVNAPSDVDCSEMFELNEENSQIIFHGMMLAKGRISQSPICVQVNSTKEKMGDLEIEFAFICHAAESECLQSTPFLLDLSIPPLDNCTESKILMNDLILKNCKYKSDDFLAISTSHFEQALASVIAVRFIKYIDKTVDYVLIPNYYQNRQKESFGFHFEASERPTWVSIGFFYRFDNYLEKFKMDHSSVICSYNVYSSFPPRETQLARRYLTTFSDDEKFVSQPMKSSLYSILIPPGCAPKCSMVDVIVEVESIGNADLRLEFINTTRNDKATRFTGVILGPETKMPIKLMQRDVYQLNVFLVLGPGLNQSFWFFGDKSNRTLGSVREKTD
ncbi:unnamed protein product, partial [Mesorhabditis belari]|uniref:Uncharacterized protein n=1 Tax=Mesorhabditis belari TaxID=2138241 RepID=A0AAF3JB41_9BILA